LMARVLYSDLTVNEVLNMDTLDKCPKLFRTILAQRMQYTMSGRSSK